MDKEAMIKEMLERDRKMLKTVGGKRTARQWKEVRTVLQSLSEKDVEKIYTYMKKYDRERNFQF